MRVNYKSASAAMKMYNINQSCILPTFDVIFNVSVCLLLHSQSIAGYSADNMEVSSMCEDGLFRCLTQYPGAESRRYSKNDCYR